MGPSIQYRYFRLMMKDIVYRFIAFEVVIDAENNVFPGFSSFSPVSFARWNKLCTRFCRETFVCLL